MAETTKRKRRTTRPRSKSGRFVGEETTTSPKQDQKGTGPPETASPATGTPSVAVKVGTKKPVAVEAPQATLTEPRGEVSEAGQEEQVSESVAPSALGRAHMEAPNGSGKKLSLLELCMLEPSFRARVIRHHCVSSAHLGQLMGN